MTTLVINGKKVKVSDDFMKLSPEDQNRTVEEIAQSMGMKSPMQNGMAELSSMTRNPRVSGLPDGPMPPPPAEMAGLPGSKPPATPQAGTNFADQFSSGLNEGIARFAGAPVDLMTGALNLGGAGINKVFGTAIPAIENPVGGSGTFTKAMDPLISDVDPQSAAQRYGRRVGQEIGFGVPAAMTGAAVPGYGTAARETMKLSGKSGALGAAEDVLRAAASPYMAASVAGDTGAALAGQTARDFAPEKYKDTADLIASLLGGGGISYLASKFTPKLAATPSLDEMKSKASELWQKVKAAPETLSDDATAGLSDAVKSSLPDNQLAREAYPNAFGMADKMDTLKNPTIYDVETARRMVGDRVAASPQESRVGVDMKGAIEDYMSGLKPADLQGGTADETLDALDAARKTTHQTKKADAILNAEMRAETRAATTGTGGNEVNATRQNVRAIFDKQRDPTMTGKRSGYTPDEMAAMETVVKGDAKSNIARLLGRMAPTSGALPMMATGWGGAAGLASGIATQNPLMAIPAAAGGIGFAAKAIAEKATKDQIAELLATVLNGGKAVGKSAARTATERAVWEQLLSSAASGQPQ